MKIGIINYHCAHNYGAMLQAYALQKYLEEEGHEVIIIDYEPDVIMNVYKIWDIRMLTHPRWLLKTIKNYYGIKSKYVIFEKFKREYLNLTNTKYTNSEQLINTNFDYDVYVCGSDQIWNMELNGGDTNYLLSFIKDAKKISYAASIGTETIKPNYQQKIKEQLLKFNSISVRESDAVRIIKDAFQLKVTQVLDPVFLLSKEQWKKISIYADFVKEPYLLLYGLEENELFNDTLKFIYENTDLKIIDISPKKKKSKYIYKHFYSIGPREFLGLIQNASVICTNSFHCTCFSIIFEKPFFTIVLSNLNSRIESVLKIGNLENHIIRKNFSSLEEFQEIINFSKKDSQNIYSKEINRSKQYLRQAIV